MNTTIEKIASNKSFSKGINFDKINKGLFNVTESVKKTFSHSLTLANDFGIANNYVSSNEGKGELKYMNIDGNKYEILEKIFGLKSTQIKLYIAVSKIPAEKIAEFKQSDKRQTLEELKKYANTTEGEGEGEGEVKEKTENLKISVDKNSKISIKGKASKQVLTLLIEELKKLLIEESTPANVKESKAA